eukprot:7236626-Alexandrium_andersonii.AAC.1
MPLLRPQGHAWPAADRVVAWQGRFRPRPWPGGFLLRYTEAYGPGKNGKPCFRDNWPGCVSGVDACAVSA